MVIRFLLAFTISTLICIIPLIAFYNGIDISSTVFAVTYTSFNVLAGLLIAALYLRC